ncbi:HvfC/BufC N-terminal domain-containing protein [Photobacterium angustum]|uniref:DUF2063 domain-containing protein n=1 Tax=Photobacterium angustum TaxID=661 RepID=A0A855S889_PHOAN|nr:DNA-binding domain-containing protein [Photobacterium angustum]KJF80302.1 hypothetical protein UB36_18190 [Photobacterium damselae subsp. damselae]KJG36875.1 hypothetical protein UA35_18590 [Photobacterium angustum]KJG43759.1 hypothetical protein UA31_18195 [Photobacterium angustum]KJG46301.1 hypothetical protein UA30_18110 [Photobacterium angustum]KJG51673.1 hypothetical protein UA34_17890 [Photobacterium angustum]
MKYAVNNELHQLQSAFSDALQYKHSYASTTIKATTFSAEQHLQIYRNNFILSLTDILSATYPAVLAMIGHDCFVQLARLHILHSPLTQGDVSHYGEGFHRTIANNETISKALPYLSDLAQLEWYRDIVSRMPSQQHGFPFEKLQHLQNSENADAFGQSYFHIPTATYVLTSQYSVGDLWHIVDGERLNHHASEFSSADDPLVTLDIDQPQTVVIQLHGNEILTQVISSDLKALIIHCQQQKSLQQASPQMLEQLPLLFEYQLTDDIVEANDG